MEHTTKIKQVFKKIILWLKESSKNCPKETKF